jgi:hypothetical protein
MQVSIARTLWMAGGAAAIVAASFIATLQVINYLSLPLDPNLDVIHVAEATFGMNCNGFKTPTAVIAEITAGNGTAAAKKRCDGAKGKCEFTVADLLLGDPAPGCGKEFSITWRCGAGAALQDFHLSAEAQQKKALLICPPQR